MRICRRKDEHDLPIRLTFAPSHKFQGTKLPVSILLFPWRKGEDGHKFVLPEHRAPQPGRLLFSELPPCEPQILHFTLLTVTHFKGRK